jgi:cation:H+ antiporter
MTDALLIVGGLVALIVGAEVLVRAATNLASWLGIRPMMIGLTVVSLGTSVPELAVGIDAAGRGNGGLAVGNIVGTNLVNLLLILGLSAALVPIALHRATLRYDLPAMTAAALLLYLVAIDGTLTRSDGIVLLLGGLAYTAGLVQVGRRETAAPAEDAPADVVATADRPRPVRVAIGTSAPELVTTIVSTLRGERDLAIGNLIGSSIYNIGAVLGLTVVVAPHGIAVPDEVRAADLGLLVVATAAAVPVFISGKRISRLEGAFFVAAYAGYMTWLLLTRT